MKITACLAWYMEPPEFLDRLVRSLAGVADVLLAVDGRWGLFPGERDLSSLEEIVAIETAARDTGLECVIHGGGAPFAWESQVEKRDYLMRHGGELGDWILVVDGDEHISHVDADAVRARLAETDLHVATALSVPMNRTWPYRDLPTNPLPARRLFRAGTRIETAHNGYRYGDEWLNGDLARVRIAQAVDLRDHLHVAHDNQNRGSERNEAARAYRRSRREERVEAWV